MGNISNKINEIILDLADAVIDGRGFIAGRKVRPIIACLQTVQKQVEEIEYNSTVIIPFKGKINEKEYPSNDLPPVA